MGTGDVWCCSETKTWVELNQVYLAANEYVSKKQERKQKGAKDNRKSGGAGAQQVRSKKKFLQGNKMYVALHNVPRVRDVTVVIHVLNKSLWLQTEKAGGIIAVIINNNTL